MVPNDLNVVIPVDDPGSSRRKENSGIKGSKKIGCRGAIHLLF